MVSRYLLGKKRAAFGCFKVSVGWFAGLPVAYTLHEHHKDFHSRWVCQRHFVISRVEGDFVCCVVVVVGYAEFVVVGYADCEFTGFRALVWVPCHRLTSL